MLCGDGRQGRDRVSEYSIPWIEIRADELLVPACHHAAAAAADRRSGDQLVPLGLGQPGHHQVVGMIDELQHFLVGHRAVQRHGVPVPLAEVVAGPDPGVTGAQADGEIGITFKNSFATSRRCRGVR